MLSQSGTVWPSSQPLAGVQQPQLTELHKALLSQLQEGNGVLTGIPNTATSNGTPSQQ